ncbi:hypothetical protein VTJ49DRAFT_2911 [Mycothermus thermophilus]|uniref:Mid2 domain-containing protein n=1 Tax=Humicola insolens TaxID=85995 RepID=A0ABR3VNP2_HUMIN
MWLLQGKGWLAAAAAALALRTARGDVVTFREGFGHPGRAIIHLNEITSRVFTWEAQNVIVRQVNLHKYDLDAKESGGIILSGQPPGTTNNVFGSHTSVSTTSTDGDLEQSLTHALTNPALTPSLPERQWQNHPPVAVNPRRPQENTVDPGSGSDGLIVRSNATGGSVMLSNGNSRAVPVSQPLYFEAIWGNDGKSYSRVFTFHDGQGPPNAELYSDPNPAFVEITDSRSAGDSSGTSTIMDGAPATGPTPNPTGSADSTDGKRPDAGASDAPVPSDISNEEDNAGGGLPQGAVIGIAVGVGVAALIAAFALAFFLLRRRQKRRDAASSSTLLPTTGGPRTGGDEDMAEKEAGNGADVSPHSPYSDDGTGAPTHSTPGPSGAAVPVPVVAPVPVPVPAAAAAVPVAGAGAEHMHDPPRSFTPYSDRPSARAGSVAGTDPEAATRVAAPSPVPGRATPRALSTPYQHLIEEGMTEEEIRRLEEEERALDAAIEQAQRRS